MAPEKLPSPKFVLSRRRLLLGAAGTMVVAACGRAPAPLPDGVFLSGQEMAVLARVCDIILPATDTPGALAAGAHFYIDGLMESWARRQTREEMRAVLAWFDATARQRSRKLFQDAPPVQQEAIVRDIDEKVLGDAVQAEQLAQDVADGYHRLKQLVFRGYYLSEVGATQELQYDPVPGGFVGCVPLAEVGRAWAT